MKKALAAFALILLVAAANARLIQQARTSQPACVGDSGLYRAAQPSC